MRRDYCVIVRLNELERRAIERTAAEAQASVSEAVREALRRLPAYDALRQERRAEREPAIAVRQ